MVPKLLMVSALLLLLAWAVWLGVHPGALTYEAAPSSGGAGIKAYGVTCGQLKTCAGIPGNDIS